MLFVFDNLVDMEWLLFILTNIRILLLEYVAFYGLLAK